MKYIKEGIDRFLDSDLHVETRTLYIGDSEEGVDYTTAKNVIKALHILQTMGPEKEINIILNSFGGCWYHGIAVYDAMMGCSCHITATVFGAAMSMGSIILQAADVRVIHPNATVMIHDGYETQVDNTPQTFQNWADYSKITRKRMYDIYAKRSGHPPSYWKRKCAADLILTAEQSVEVGLVDRIFGDESTAA